MKELSLGVWVICTDQEHFVFFEAEQDRKGRKQWLLQNALFELYEELI